MAEYAEIPEKLAAVLASKPAVLTSGLVSSFARQSVLA